MEPHIQYADSRDGLKVAFYAMGDGPATVLMDSLPFRHILKQWEINPTVRQVAQFFVDYGRRFVQFDPRGMGLSSPIEQLTPNGLVLDLDAVVDHLELETFDLVAYNYSCPVALQYAAGYPSRVNKLALEQPFVCGVDALKTTTGRAARSLRDREWEVYVDTVNHLTQRGDKRGAEVSAALMRAVGPEMVREVFSLVDEVDLGAMLPEVTAPTLVYCPREEGLIATSQCREVAAAIPNAELLVSDEIFIIAAGRFMGLLDTDAASVPGAAAAATVGYPAGLTKREVEVLLLIAVGRTNREIADELVISTNTVDRHVSHILAKTNTANRAEAASFATRQGLTA